MTEFTYLSSTNKKIIVFKDVKPWISLWLNVPVLTLALVLLVCFLLWLCTGLALGTLSGLTLNVWLKKLETHRIWGQETQMSCVSTIIDFYLIENSKLLNRYQRTPSLSREVRWDNRKHVDSRVRRSEFGCWLHYLQVCYHELKSIVTLEFTFYVAHSMGFDPCVMTCIYHHSIIQNTFSALKILCSSPYSQVHWSLCI